MAKEIKSIVSFEDSLAKLDIRVGRVIEVGLETRTHKPTYRMLVDFGKYGRTGSRHGETFRVLNGFEGQFARNLVI